MRRASIVLAALISLGGSASAFDTRWHWEATLFGARAAGFDSAAAEYLEIGDFAPDFFGPIGDHVESVAAQRLTQLLPNERRLTRYRDAAGHDHLRRAGTLLHFDDLARRLDGSPAFGALFDRLLANTRATIVSLHNRTDVADPEKRVLILLALGSSLHMVQDFYSHSNWIHIAPILRPIEKGPIPSNEMDSNVGDVDHAKRLDAELAHAGALANAPFAPAWFDTCNGEPCSRLNGVASGVYPDDQAPAPDKSHAYFNHDSARAPSLHYLGLANPYSHQIIAVASAARASADWLRRAGEEPAARAAIDFAHGPLPAAGTLRQNVRTISCLTGHWNGPRGCPDVPDLVADVALKPSTKHALVHAAIHLIDPALAKLAGALREVHGPEAALAAGVAIAVAAVSAAAVASLTTEAVARELESGSQGMRARYDESRILERLSAGIGDPESGRYTLSPSPR